VEKQKVLHIISVRL